MCFVGKDAVETLAYVSSQRMSEQAKERLAVSRPPLVLGLCSTHRVLLSDAEMGVRVVFETSQWRGRYAGVHNLGLSAGVG